METNAREKLIVELTDMGFSRSTVMQVLENADGVPKDVIVEQLLTSTLDSGYTTIPVVDDDGDPLWQDVPEAIKMVIVINSGLNMGVGKIASQAAHAALGLYEETKNRPGLTSDLDTWNEQGSRKIVVHVKNTDELLKLCTVGKLHKVPFFCVLDAGLTEVKSDSFTAIAFFGSDDQLKPVTGKLRLLK